MLERLFFYLFWFNIIHKDLLWPIVFNDMLGTVCIENYNLLRSNRVLYNSCEYCIQIQNLHDYQYNTLGFFFIPLGGYYNVEGVFEDWWSNQTTNKWIDAKKCVENYYNNQSMGPFTIPGQTIPIKVCSIVLNPQSNSAFFRVPNFFPYCCVNSLFSIYRTL